MALTTYIVICVLMVFLVACFLVSRILDSSIIPVFTKTLASIGMVFGAVLSVKYMVSNIFVFVTMGLIFGMLGDIFLELKKQYSASDFTYFNIGMACFVLGHIMYIIALITKFGTSYNYLTAGVIAICVAVLFTSLLFFVFAKPLNLDFKRLKWQSFGYSILLVFTMVFSLVLSIQTNTNWLFTIGLIVFLLSDLVLSCQYFTVTKNGKNLTFSAPLIVINHILYYAAQVLILSVLYL